MSAVCDCLFNIFAATLLIGGRSSIRNPRTRHAVVTGTHLSHGDTFLEWIIRSFLSFYLNKYIFLNNRGMFLIRDVFISYDR